MLTASPLPYEVRGEESVRLTHIPTPRASLTKLRVTLNKRLDSLFILASQHRTGRVDKLSARRDPLRRFIEHPLLRLNERIDSL